MKKLNKILIIPILLYCLCLSITSAETEISDCEIFSNRQYSHTGENGFDIVNIIRETGHNYTNFLTPEEQKSIITKNDLNTAILNLKKQCCSKEKFSKLSTCQDENIFFNDNSLESEILFNHLFDVIMRRLNGLDGDNDIYKKSKMTTDDLGTQRRNRINNEAESTQGSTPQTISTEYDKFRSQSSPEKGYDISDAIYSEFSQNEIDFLNFVKGEGTGDSKKVAKALKEYENRTLYDRYKNSCALTEYFYTLLLIGSPSSSDKKKVTYIIKDRCDELVNKQISGESEYVQSVIKRSANLFLSNYIQGYMSYMYERQMTLQKLRKECGDRFLDVVRAVSCLQEVCVK